MGQKGRVRVHSDGQMEYSGALRDRRIKREGSQMEGEREGIEKREEKRQSH